MCENLLPDFFKRPRAFGQFFAGNAVALHDALNPDEQIRPDRLRAKVAAPYAAKQARHKEKQHGGENKYSCEDINFLRPYLDKKPIGPCVGKVNQYGLIGHAGTTVPADKRHKIIDAERDDHRNPFQVAKAPADALWINDFTLGKVFNGLRVIHLRQRDRRAPAADRLWVPEQVYLPRPRPIGEHTQSAP